MDIVIQLIVTYLIISTVVTLVVYQIRKQLAIANSLFGSLCSDYLKELLQDSIWIGIAWPLAIPCAAFYGVCMLIYTLIEFILFKMLKTKP